ncbi:ParB/RepB/Spo0J family partition protein [Rhodosalinus sediminis]|uniref:ParB/RepB/Spo0J family partition protein n=1 Tax=Rhodosalinus sediminis TaxID=1940533 RepID=A0A3D9BW64_9RHOB|nr:ParB/RepB/Spo0J family partition protein [Rhodosalinus sediminis]REC57757.1 ParB/RepB/Spo0J family partition protein [Rhodosalinus sediminis]
MTDKTPKSRGLGRGLSALMADIGPEEERTPDAPAPRPTTTVPIDRIAPNPDQPRRTFGEEELAELAKSIAARGILQPLIVRPDPEKPGHYQIVAGERRWRAAQRAQVHDVPVIERELSDLEVLEVAIIENIQRADLNPVEEAAGYRQLLEKFGHTQDQLAEALGKSRSHIANAIRLLKLPDEVQAMARDGSLSAGHARALITASDPVALARTVAMKDLSVRETEALVRKGAAEAKGAGGAERRKRGGEKDADTRALESDLSAMLGMKVAIEHKAGAESGKLVIEYPDLDQLDALCNKLSG